MQTHPPTDKMRCLITGGGTAGHVYPALALAEGIQGHVPDAEFLFVGARGGAEERLIPAAGHTLRTLGVRGLPSRARPLDWSRTIWQLGRSILQAIRIILTWRPQAIIGTGGYASAPVLLAAILLRSLGLWRGLLSLQEANIIPGRFNRWVSGWVDFTGTSFPETLRYLPRNRSFWTGFPLRKDLEASSAGNREARRAQRERMGVPPTARVLLVFGGSSGARTINRAVFEALPSLLAMKDLYVLHATGYPQGGYDPNEEFRRILPTLPVDKTQVQERYRQELYFHDIERYYEIADLVVCRSGAGTVWETASYGIPAVFIPKSNLPGDHQVKNAYFLARQGQSRLLFETRPVPPEPPGPESVDADALAGLVRSILDDPITLDRMKNSARERSLPSGRDLFYDVLRDMLDRKLAPSRGTKETARHGASGHGQASGEGGIEWLGKEALVAHVEAKRKRKQELTADETGYLRYKADQLLCSPRWQDRNIGVKLVGLIGYKERLPALLDAITDRTPVPWPWKFLGGDYRQVGFIRRNALQAVWRIPAYDPGVREALMKALRDPYYEVRSWAALAIDRLSPLIGEDAELERLLRKNLKDRWFEVVVYSLRAIGKTTKDPAILPDLVPLLAHRNWKVQQATVRCLMRLLQSDVVRLPLEAEDWICKVPMKGLDFFPRFPLKQTWDDFRRLLSERVESAKQSHTGERGP